MIGCLFIILAFVFAGFAFLVGGPFLAMPVLLFMLLVAVVAKR
jgi:hypothetical protein